MSIYFIADTHFGDERIIRYENRPFENAAQMESAITYRWNETVCDDDEVFVLGDFSASASMEENARLLAKLNGHKRLIMGNHDLLSADGWMQCGFEFASPYPVIYGGFWLLSHEPLYVNSNMPYANIFGHVHACRTYKDCSEQSFCVSVERIDYRPVSLEHIRKKTAEF